MSQDAPQDKSGEDLSILEEVDSVCDRFDAEWRDWRSGPQPRIEEYLAQATARARPMLLKELLRVDIAYRRRHGQSPTPADYQARFPRINPAKLPELFAHPKAQATSTPAASTPPASTGPYVPAAGPLPSITANQDTAPAVSPKRRDFGDYELLRRLGQGGMGVVYLARQRSADRLAALKLIRLDQLEYLTPQQRREWVGRFRTEGRAAARLRHENIVTVYEVGTVDGTPFYSMAYIDGHSLEAELRERPLPNAEAAALMDQVARAVGCAHEHGVLHRDLKPQNILVDRKGRPYVADFGLAKWTGATEGPTQTGQLLGSPPYMSPEQATDAANVAEATDIYSLGATLYALVTGKPPFQAASVAETLDQVRRREPVSPRLLNPAVDRDLDTIILRCLQKEPDRRYASAQGLADDLHAYCNGRPIKARPIRTWERAWMWCRRNPTVAALLAACLIALTVGAAFSSYFAREAGHQADRAEEAGGNLAKTEEELGKAEGEKKALSDELMSSLARSFLRPIGLHDQLQALTDPEIKVLWELAQSPDKRVWHRFVKDALKDPVTIRQLRRRADIALPAAVGLDLDKRAEAEQLILERLQAADLAEDQRLDLALVAAGLGGLTPAGSARVAQALAQALTRIPTGNEYTDRSRDTFEDADTQTEVARGLTAVCASMEAKEAAEFLSKALIHVEKPRPGRMDVVVLSKGGRPAPPELARALAAVTARLDPKDAVMILSRAMGEVTNGHALGELAFGLAVAARRLPAQDAGAVVTVLNRALTIEERFNDRDERNRLRHGMLDDLRQIGVARGIFSLADHLDPHQAAGALVECMRNLGPGIPEDCLLSLVNGLSVVSRRIDTDDAGSLGAQVSDMVAKGGTPVTQREQARALLLLAPAMKKEMAAQLCLRSVRQLIQQLSQQTGFSAEDPLAAAISMLAGYLPSQATSQLASPFLEDFRRTAGTVDLERSSLALASLAAGMDVKTAANAADVIAKAAQPVDPVGRNAWLARYLRRIARRMEPKDAATVLSATLAKVFDSPAASELASGLSEVLVQLDPRAAVEIFQSEMTEAVPSALPPLARGLSVVGESMEQNEAAPICLRAANYLTQAMARPHTTADALGQLAQGLAALAPRLPPQSSRQFRSNAAGVLMRRMDKRKIDDPEWSVALLAQGLAALAPSLDASESAQYCAHAAECLVREMTRSDNVNLLRLYAEALSALVGHLTPEEAQRACSTCLVALLRVSGEKLDAYQAEQWRRAMHALAIHLDARNAENLCHRIVLSMARMAEVEQHPWLKDGLSFIIGMPDAKALSQRSGVIINSVALGATIPGRIAVPCIMSSALDPVSVRLSTPALIELLKQPTCVAFARRVILDELENRYRRTFADCWAFVRYAEEHGLYLEFTTPPKRPVLTQLPLAAAPVP